MSDPRIGSFFDPQSVAVIGASADLAKASGLPLRNIVNSRFTGKIYPVNPRATEICGLACYPTVTELPEAPDVAILMIDAKLTAQVLEMRPEGREDHDHRLGRVRRSRAGRSSAPGRSQCHRQTLQHPRLRPQLSRHV